MLNQLLRQVLNDPSTQIFFLGPLLLILVDLITGIIRAVYRKNFDSRLLGDFAHTNLVPYVALLVPNLAIPLLLVGINATAYEAAGAGAKGLMIAFMFSQVASIVQNVAVVSGAPEVTVDALLRALLFRVLPFTRPSIDTVAMQASAGTVAPVRVLTTEEYLGASASTQAATATGAIQVSNDSAKGE